MLQAAIAVLHVEEPQDWPQFAALYGELARVTGSPVVELNHAAAVAEAGDVEAALEIVERLELDHYHYLHSTRAELLRRLDRVEDARSAYERALELVHSDAERRFLEQRLAGLGRLAARGRAVPVRRAASPPATRFRRRRVWIAPSRASLAARPRSVRASPILWWTGSEPGPVRRPCVERRRQAALPV